MGKRKINPRNNYQFIDDDVIDELVELNEKYYGNYNLSKSKNLLFPPPLLGCIIKLIRCYQNFGRYHRVSEAPGYHSIYGGTPNENLISRAFSKLSKAKH